MVRSMDNSKITYLQGKCLVASPSLDDERFRNTSFRSQNRKELKGIIEDSFRSSKADEVLEKLQRNGIANAKMADMDFEHGESDSDIPCQP